MGVRTKELTFEDVSPCGISDLADPVGPPQSPAVPSAGLACPRLAVLLLTAPICKLAQKTVLA